MENPDSLESGFCASRRGRKIFKLEALSAATGQQDFLLTQPSLYELSLRVEGQGRKPFFSS
jgi:uncharacterized membrane protein